VKRKRLLAAKNPIRGKDICMWKGDMGFSNRLLYRGPAVMFWLRPLPDEGV